jgi:hypothetical protein
MQVREEEAQKLREAEKVRWARGHADTRETAMVYPDVIVTPRLNALICTCI